MPIIVSILVIFLAAITLLVLRFRWPGFRYPWIIAAGGAVVALIVVFLWHLHFPQSFSLFTLAPQAVFSYSLTWLADSASWPYALSLTGLAAAVIWTSVVRAENDPGSWAGTLMLTALGILAVTAANPLTLVLMWTALDLAELLTMLPSTEGESRSESVVVAFAARLTGTGLVLWASTVSASAGTPMDFRAMPIRTGIYLLLAVGLRLGVLPLHLPYRQENVIPRGFGTALRLVSSASSLALLAHIPANALDSPFVAFLLVLVAIAALYSGWRWLRASDELFGRPFWVLGMASLAVAASLRSNPTGSIAWGVALILGGGFLFLYSARQSTLLWSLILAFLGLTALPYSLTASGWQSGDRTSWLFLIPFLPGQALLLAGFIRHAFHPGETSFESQARWSKVIYPSGLIFLIMIEILLGVWGWDGSQTVGLWLASVTALVLTAGFIVYARTVLARSNLVPGADRWAEIFRLNWLYHALWDIYRFLGRIANQVTATLEGEGGVLWSIVLLVLILSILSTRGR